MEFGSTTLQQAFIGMFWQRLRMTLQQLDKAAFAVHVNALNADTAILKSGLLDGPAYVAGPEFSMADITTGSLFYRIIDLYPNFFLQYPKVIAWHKAIVARAGYTKWVATAYAELKVL